MSHIHEDMHMAVHHLNWSTTASALENEHVIAQALDWLTGGNQDIEIKGEKSYHGATLHRISCHISKKSDAVKSLPRLGETVLNEILQTLEDRLDEENVLHIRLELNALTRAQIRIGDPKKNSTVKCRIKLQVWPGEECAVVAKKLIEGAIEIARTNKLPSLPESLD